MQEEPFTPLQPISQGDTNRQLALPPDLIHRGLELAKRLQGRQEISNFQPQTSREFLVRCEQLIFNVKEKGDDGINQSKLLPGNTIDLFISICPEGMVFSKIPPEHPLDFTPLWNESVYAWLKSLGTGDPPCIRIADYQLVYYLYLDEHGNPIMELVPSENLSFTGPNTRGDPERMVAVSILLLNAEPPAILQLLPMDKRKMGDLEALRALVASINTAKKKIP